MTEAFLTYLQTQGNDLVTPAPEHGFPGLKPGDCWCVCAGSWADAFQAGVACPIYLESTHQRALEKVPLEALMTMAVGDEV